MSGAFPCFSVRYNDNGGTDGRLTHDFLGRRKKVKIGKDIHFSTTNILSKKETARRSSPDTCLSVFHSHFRDFSDFLLLEQSFRSDNMQNIYDLEKPSLSN